VVDTLFMAAGIIPRYVGEVPASGPLLYYGSLALRSLPRERCILLAHSPGAWAGFDGTTDIARQQISHDLCTVLPHSELPPDAGFDVCADILANAFYFLTSWSERLVRGAPTRGLSAASVFARLQVPIDIVDRYLARLVDVLQRLLERLNLAPAVGPDWGEGRRYAVVLSHDVDFLPSGMGDVLIQGAKTFARHLVRQADPVDAARALAGLVSAVARGRDPYGCVPHIIHEEQCRGVRASFQVAVGRRHQNDVRYRVEDDKVRDYLRVIPESGFDLCLHGSYLSTQNSAWYVEEAELLAARLGRPLGSRQHYLSFEYDTLFSAQEQAGIQYDMSMGFPDAPGPRAGFSFPYFPFNLRENRPYDVLEISLFLMDVTLRGYLGLKGARAWEVMESHLADLRRKGGCASVVWHPIVFGGARDPGDADLFWKMVEYIKDTRGLATDGRELNALWRARARQYSSFCR